MPNNHLKRQINNVLKKGRFVSTTIEFEDEGLEGGVYAKWGDKVVWPQYNPEGVVLFNARTKKKRILRSKFYHTKFDRISSEKISG